MFTQVVEYLNACDYLSMLFVTMLHKVNRLHPENINHGFCMSKPSRMLGYLLGVSGNILSFGHGINQQTGEFNVMDKFSFQSFKAWASKQCAIEPDAALRGLEVNSTVIMVMLHSNFRELVSTTEESGNHLSMDPYISSLSLQ